VFVEIVRLFIVLLATLGGYAAGKSTGGPGYPGAAALGGMLGCQIGRASCRERV